MSYLRVGVEADLQALGAYVSPQAQFVTHEVPDYRTTNAVILDRIKDIDGDPPYCTHGYATCVKCDEYCYLGNKTAEVVASRQAFPLCRPCALERTSLLAKVMQVEDHQRADGPHE